MSPFSYMNRIRTIIALYWFCSSSLAASRSFSDCAICSFFFWMSSSIRLMLAIISAISACRESISPLIPCCSPANSSIWSPSSSSLSWSCWFFFFRSLIWSAYAQTPDSINTVNAITRHNRCFKRFFIYYWYPFYIPVYTYCAVVEDSSVSSTVSTFVMVLSFAITSSWSIYIL